MPSVCGRTGRVRRSRAPQPCAAAVRRSRRYGDLADGVSFPLPDDAARDGEVARAIERLLRA